MAYVCQDERIAPTVKLSSAPLGGGPTKNEIENLHFSLCRYICILCNGFPTTNKK